MSSYAELYAYCQGVRGRIGRGKLFPKVAELTKLPRPKQMISGKLNPGNVLGFIVFPNGSDTRLTQFTQGAPLIVIARDLSPEWRRFVMIKELMHYFDQALETVSSADEFESLVGEISAPPLRRSPAMDSEIKAFWMALGVVCNEEKRQEFQRKIESGQLSHAGVAAELKLPESVITALFEPNFKTIIAGLIG